ncbi:MAG: transporter substrate-binding domain-containing protein [Curvibacter lanceolatus]|uniref:transporter substrate-binding domain-containing protein n=1 Tax=Curvibacter lanceolatus TaxID=86182 RepID=UPI002353EF77|nr:transporter substrate-binding domain-containing protein [Curvibacter lanceolatus]MBV5295214.1 transporter substrate-binding domain-containing protein [Curvibacter lanceolatus]
MCGSTTHHAERREKVAFTVPHFIVGARILVRANSTVTRLEDLSNKTGGRAGGAFRAGDERFFVARRRGFKNFFLINSLVSMHQKQNWQQISVAGSGIETTISENSPQLGESVQQLHQIIQFHHFVAPHKKVVPMNGFC